MNPTEHGSDVEEPTYDCAFWQEENNAAEKRLDTYHRNANEANQRYLDTPHDKPSGTSASRAYRLNMFYANTSTLIDMMYGAVPKVSVSRRYSDPKDDVARMAALIMERLLTEGVEARNKRFGPKIRAALQDRLIPGLGSVKWRYETDGEKTENVTLDYHHWRDCRWAYARTWDDVWWFGYVIRMTLDEAKERFGAEKAATLTYEQAEPDKNTSEYGADNEDTQQTTQVLEIYCKRTREVYWVPRSGDTGLLDQKKDTFEIQDFYPFPPPMMANPTTTSYMPTPDWWLAQDLYKEIDVLQTRKHYLIKALRVRGAYDQNVPGLAQLLNQGENSLAPVDMTSLSERGGLSKAVEFIPLETIAATLNQVNGELAQNLALLDQITGMPEMMRGGGTQGSERVPVAERHYQSKYGSIKVQSKQDVFEEFVASALEIRAEIISKMYSPESIIEQSNAKYIMELAPPKNQQDPAQMQRFMQGQQLLAAAIELIKDSGANAWRVKIQPQSLAMVDRTALKQERTEALQALGVFTQSMAGIIQNAPETGSGLIQLLGWGLQGFRGADEIEGIVGTLAEAYQQGQAKRDAEPKDDPASTAMQVTQMKIQGDLQKTQMQIQGDMQEIMAKAQADAQKQREQGMFDQRKMMAEFQLTMKEMLQEYGLKAKLATHEAQLDAQVESGKQEAQAEWNTRERVGEAVLKQQHPDPVEIARLEVDREKARNTGGPAGD